MQLTQAERAEWSTAPRRAKGPKPMPEEMEGIVNAGDYNLKVFV